MNEFLAELYGTNDIIASDPSPEETEKLAAAEFLVKLAAEEGVDLDALSDEQVGELLAEVEKTAAVQPEPQIEDEAQEKLAEADFLGRAMAHAYVNELAEIEKQAGARTEAAKEMGKKLLEKIKGVPGKLHEWSGVKGAREAHAALGAAKKEKENLAQGIRTLAAKGDKGTQSMRSLGTSHAGAAKDVKTYKALRREYGKQFAKRVGLPAVGLAATGVGAKALMGGKEKRQFDEEFEALAQQRAYEMLEEAGYDTEKQAEAETSIGMAIEERALDMLQEAGYPVE